MQASNGKQNVDTPTSPTFSSKYTPALVELSLIPIQRKHPQRNKWPPDDQTA